MAEHVFKHGPECGCIACKAAARFWASGGKLRPAVFPVSERVVARDGSVAFVISKGADGSPLVAVSQNDPDLELGRWKKLLVDGGLIEANAEPALRPREALSPQQRKMLSALEQPVRNAVLWGTTGTGKTEVALFALRALHQKRVSVKPIVWQRLKEAFMPTQRDESGLSERDLLHLFVGPTVLLLDELGGGHPGMQRVSDFECRLLADLLSARDRSGRWTWVTTNLDPGPDGRLMSLYPAPAMSRLMRQDASCILDFTGMKNWRQK